MSGDFIVDPDDKTQAIYAPTGKMAARVFFRPASDDFDPATPTINDDTWVHIGFAAPEPIPLPENPYVINPRFSSAD